MDQDPVIGGDVLLAKYVLDDALFADDAVHASVLLVGDDGQPYIEVDVEPGHSNLQMLEDIPVQIVINERPIRQIAPLIDGESDASVAVFDRRYNPLRPGGRIQNKRGRIGTLGLNGFHISTGQPAILSNWHVMSHNEGVVGDLIAQPRGSEFIARLRNGALPSENAFSYDVDAAAATLLGNRRTSNVPLGIGGREVASTQAAYVTQRVVKSGRTTEDTHGVVRSVTASVRVNYEGRRELYRNQILIRPYPPKPVAEISGPGDSGAVWLDFSTQRAVGLHFAGETGNAPDTAWANPIDQAMLAVDFRLRPVTDTGVTVYQFWFSQGGFNGRYDHWFKNDPASIPGYSSQGAVFRWFSAPASGRTAVYQWFSQVRFNHYYHLGSGDSFVPGTDYVRQNVAGYVSDGQLPGMVQLWIGYNERILDHHLTTNRTELTANGYGSIGSYGFVYPA